MNYFSMMMLNSFMQQIPVLTNANLLAMTVQSSSSPPFDPLEEIRNGLKKRLSMKRKKFSFDFSSTTKSGFGMASFFS
jgi:hypothetical protein